MQNTDIQERYPDLVSYLHLNYDSQPNQEQPEPTRTETTANLREQKASQLGTSIFLIAIITIYGLGIHQFTKTVINIVDTVVEEVNKDYRFIIF